MNTILLKKELSGLRFCILLGLSFSVITVIYLLFTAFLDRPIDAGEPEDLLLSWVLMGSFIGMTAMNQEREHQTQGFLDGLAVSRLSVFLHKVLAALLIVAFFCLVNLTLSLVFDGLSRTSVSGRIEWELLLAECSLELLLGFTVVATGMVLSFTRKWFPLAAGLVFLALVLLATSKQGWVAWIDSTALVSPALADDGTLMIPWKQVAGFSLFASVALLLAWMLFRWRDGILSRWFERDFPIWQKVVVGVLVAGVWVTTLFLFGISQNSSLEDDPLVDSAGDLKGIKLDQGIVGFASHETKHYDVIFRESQREDVMKLAGDIDGVYQQVANYFLNPSLPSGRIDETKQQSEAPMVSVSIGNPRLPSGRIVLDVASSVPSHAAGVANWTKIRVPMAKLAGKMDVLQVIRHETAHVFIEQLSDGKASDSFNEMRAFHEGVATAVEVSPDDEVARAERHKLARWAALVHSRGEVPLALLCDDAKLTERFDDSVVYPLGYVFAKALVEIGGPTLPRRVLETLKSSSPPPTSDPSIFWQVLLQKCDTSWEAALAAYSGLLDDLKTQEEAYVAGFPRLSAKVTVEGEDIVIRLDPFSGEAAGAKPFCRVMISMGLTEREQIIPRSEDGSFRLKRSRHVGNRLSYFLGWASEEMAYPVFEPRAEAWLK